MSELNALYSDCFIFYSLFVFNACPLIRRQVFCIILTKQLHQNLEILWQQPEHLSFFVFVIQNCHV